MIRRCIALCRLAKRPCLGPLLTYVLLNAHLLLHIEHFFHQELKSQVLLVQITVFRLLYFIDYFVATFIPINKSSLLIRQFLLLFLQLCNLLSLLPHQPLLVLQN